MSDIAYEDDDEEESEIMQEPSEDMKLHSQRPIIDEERKNALDSLKMSIASEEVFKTPKRSFMFS